MSHLIVIPPSTGAVTCGATHLHRALAQLLATVIRLWTSLQLTARRSTAALGRRLRDDRGQATTEYALVLLAAALVALLVVAWATAGGGAARISGLFNRVIDAVIDRV
ncbi:MAG: hypothetical protein AAFP84_11865 [Actinomycetota bacterium]